jgi:hypothetical protein
MAVIRAQISIERLSRLPEDRSENTMHFITSLPQPLDGELTAIEGAIIDFYNTPPVGANAIAQHFSNLVATGSVHTIKMYNLGQPKPRPPVYQSAFALVGPQGNGLPAEVATCLSYRAAQMPGVPAARRRGRIYLGPLNQTSVASQITNSDVKPSDALILALLGAGERLMNHANATWAVYSQMDAMAREITQVSVDNAFDTQRRRGGKPTARLMRTAL